MKQPGLMTAQEYLRGRLWNQAYNGWRLSIVAVAVMIGIRRMFIRN